MYITRLPDHSDPQFDEAAHFARFRKQNMVFSAESHDAHCDEHIGCLSVKTLLRGAETYGIDGRKVTVRPGQFLILNNDQPYSCRISGPGAAHALSVFFKSDFAAAVLTAAMHTDAYLLDEPFFPDGALPSFFQHLHDTTPLMQHRLQQLVQSLETQGYVAAMVDEQLVFLLHDLAGVQQADRRLARDVQALKPATRHELFRRLCVAKDVLHTAYHEPLDLERLCREACLSVPQLVRQFKSVFRCSPYQYLVRVRLEQAAQLLRQGSQPAQDIAWQCGFENAGAFGRAFKSMYGVPPMAYRQLH
ncbi:AraC family transcriptional regulator [Chitinophaga caseinilytica]|uniref:AraC family transcriptional regulator n=1 Tax=Chitinophaga caseinilytica TaxID=2267521 RepID=A0ABZ2YZ47_9BACT